MTFAEVTEPFDTGHREFGALSPLLWQPLGSALVERAGPRPGERVLDACCGDGASAIPAARAVGESGHVDAVDGAAGLLELGRTRATDLPQLRFARADVTAWRTEQRYDLVQCAYGVFFLPDMDASCRRLIGMLTGGGRFAVSAWRYPAIREFATCLIAAVEEEQGKPLPAPSSVQPAERIDNEGKLHDWLASLGLVSVQTWTVPFECPLTDPEVAWMIVTGTGFRGMLDRFDDAGVERVRQGLLRRIDERRLHTLDATSVIGVGTRQERSDR
ncbi:MAG: methyltransferase domain-containing protein [Streptosporangiales bacterium]|nr:methyltransferase domain-containing protein [Streptosporangiales bacterium]